MWIDLNRHLHEKEVAARPDYQLLLDSARDKHLDTYHLEFRTRAVGEQ